MEFLQEYEKQAEGTLKAWIKQATEKMKFMYELMRGLYQVRHEYAGYKLGNNKLIKMDEEEVCDLLLTAEVDEINAMDAYLQKKHQFAINDILEAIKDAPWVKLLKLKLAKQSSEVLKKAPEEIAADLKTAAAGKDEARDKLFVEFYAAVSSKQYVQVNEAFNKSNKTTLRELLEKELKGFSEYAFLILHDYLMGV